MILFCGSVFYTFMIMKAIILLVCFLSPAISRAQDSLPPLSSLPEADIDTVFSSYQSKIVTVKMVNGKEYHYQYNKLGMLSEKSISGKRYQAVNGLEKVFTKSEFPPYYPGGEQGWEKYIEKFRAAHADQFKGYGHFRLKVHFLADFDGNLYEINVNGPGDQLFHSLALQAIKESGQWMSAIQNHYKVTCYHSLEMKF